MKYIAILLVTVMACFQLHAQSSIYSYSVDSAGGGEIHFSQFSGRKILIVDVASRDSTTFRQWGELVMLSQSFPDSLVIVVVPTNSFGTEPLPNDSLGEAYSNHGLIVVAARTEVSGGNVHALYQWLTTLSLNGVMDSPVNGAFKKFLIDRNGRLAGVYGSRVTPTDAVLFEAILNL